MIQNKDIAVANATSRNSGAVGPKALVPKLVREMASKSDKILDFGAGKYAGHARALKQDGYNVTAYDFGDNVIPNLHDKKALSKTYDFVYASNVLNVQNSLSMLRETILQIHSVLRQEGTAIVNFPVKPRKDAYKGLKNKEAVQLLDRELSKKFKVTRSSKLIFQLKKGVDD